ncbi:hypothetical protein BRPE64_ECDS02970 (plasmid) [Caballeronia insecticola]|uniref:Uncharacterized protein n=1 Tax=Caballeronia insecticola TaxID=758793 RepID=A0A060PRA9_9BURK|nr:hypothetical protein BRPE64_ECDS02970 [Caballeronia insecticola]
MESVHRYPSRTALVLSVAACSCCVFSTAAQSWEVAPQANASAAAAVVVSPVSQTVILGISGSTSAMRKSAWPALVDSLCEAMKLAAENDDRVLIEEIGRH